MDSLKAFYSGKKILVTGNTGFKGSWMCRVLTNWGADVVGYGLAPAAEDLYSLVQLEEKVKSYYADIRDYDALLKVFETEKPEIVIHMAAQPLVRESYDNPRYTYDVNVMGTVNVMECIRKTSCVKSFVNVTTDKVYENKEWEWGYRENEALNGYDPYSNSKSCSELVTSSYKKSFFADGSIAVSTARAGNVIGGGDFAKDRIVPDCVRAAVKKEAIEVRNPNSVRPYQHVLEPVVAYLLIAMKQYEDKALCGNYNVGPAETDCLTTGQLVTAFCKAWESETKDAVTWQTDNEKGPHEANFLKLDCAHIARVMGWKPRWNAKLAIQKSAEWYAIWSKGQSVEGCMLKQILEYTEISGE